MKLIIEGIYSVFSIKFLLVIIFLKVSTKLRSKFPNKFKFGLFFIILIKTLNNLSIKLFL